jgi:hypothetical protein
MRPTATWLAVLLVSLAACEPTPRTPSAVSGETLAPAPTPPATPAPADSASATTLTPTGLGAMREGMSSADAASVTGGSLTVPASSSADQCDYATWPSAPKGVYVMFVGGTLARIDVREPGIRTTDGIEVGASAAQVEATYGARAVRRPHKYQAGEYFVVQPLAPADTVHRLMIEVTGGRVGAMHAGRFPMVEWVEGCS